MESKMYMIDDDSVLPILLKYLYNNQDINKIFGEINNNNIYCLLALAHCVGAVRLSKQLEEIIAEQYLNNENCVRVYWEALMVILYFYNKYNFLNY
jgi:hypothetical protein